MKGPMLAGLVLMISMTTVGSTVPADHATHFSRIEFRRESSHAGVSQRETPEEMRAINEARKQITIDIYSRFVVSAAMILSLRYPHSPDYRRGVSFGGGGGSIGGGGGGGGSTSRFVISGFVTGVSW